MVKKIIFFNKIKKRQEQQEKHVILLLEITMLIFLHIFLMDKKY